MAIEGFITIGQSVCILRWEPQEGTAPLYRSEAPHDGFVKIEDEIDLSQGYYEDEYNAGNYGIVYYKLGDSLLHLFEIPNAYAKEITRRDRWFLQQNRFSGGTKAYAIIASRTGAKCPYCWDEVKEKTTVSNCKICYGTGMKKPYYDPIKIGVDFRPTQNHRRALRERISTKGFQTSMWTSNIPLLKPNDQVLFRGLMYRVLSGINYTRIGLYITKQQIPLEAIGIYKPGFAVPIPETNYYVSISGEIKLEDEDGDA